MWEESAELLFRFRIEAITGGARRGPQRLELYIRSSRGLSRVEINCVLTKLTGFPALRLAGPVELVKCFIVASV